MKRPNHLIAPIVIVGITVGFLVSAYKFVFVKPRSSKSSTQLKHVDIHHEYTENTNLKH